jgi:U6 snRNA-associated Sm-like protein LSm6
MSSGIIQEDIPMKDNRNNNKEQEGRPLKNPGDFVSLSVGQPVTVRLHSGVDYRGTLTCLDGYLNIALEQTQEWVQGSLTHSYGDTFIRGNNGLSFFSCTLSLIVYLLILFLFSDDDDDDAVLYIARLHKA